MSKGCWEINRSRLCLSLPAVKAGYGLRGGRFALETRCSFFTAASNLFLNEQPCGADSPLVISEPMVGGVGVGSGGCGHQKLC